MNTLLTADTISVAKNLLGYRLVHESDEGITAGIMQKQQQIYSLQTDSRSFFLNPCALLRNYHLPSVTTNARAE